VELNGFSKNRYNWGVAVIIAALLNIEVDSKRTKTKMNIKKRIGLISIFLCLFLSFSLLILKLRDARAETSAREETNRETMKKLFPKVSRRNIYKFTDPKETIDFLKKGTGILFLAMPGSKWCQEYAPVLDKAARYRYAKEILYFDPSLMGNDLESYKEILKLLKKYTQRGDDGELAIPLPSVYFLLGGKIVGFNGDLSKLSENDANAQSHFTDDKETALLDKLYSLTRRVTDGKCDCD
jgi:hypothetical protein